MDEDVYRPPKSEVNNQIDDKGSAVKAILIATVIDVTATIFIGMVISIVYGVLLASNGDSLEMITAKLSNVDLTSKVSLLTLFLAFLVTTYTGYLCAKIVNHSEYRIAAIFAVILIIFGLIMGLPYYSVSENIFLSLMTLFSVYIGAWFHVSQKKRRLSG
ncbi:MAG: hypothetical protein ABW092_08270 [Candidatus Thiodiazotropha sp.]